jgi:hypothetical protein
MNFVTKLKNGQPIDSLTSNKLTTFNLTNYDSTRDRL